MARDGIWWSGLVLLALFIFWVYGILFAPLDVRLYVMAGTVFIIYIIFMKALLVDGIKKGTTYTLFPQKKKSDWYWTGSVLKKNNSTFFYTVLIWNIVITSIIISIIILAFLTIIVPETIRNYFIHLTPELVRSLIIFIIIVDVALGLINNTAKNSN